MAPRNRLASTCITRRRFLATASAVGLSPGIALNTACAPNDDFPAAARALRHPLRDSAEHLRSSAAVAVFVGARGDPASWFEVGRAYERFALAATALGVRTAFVNQPVEASAVRLPFASWLGIGSQRPDLVVRLGHGPLLPYSLRRPAAAVIV